jgi:hypothetical protein
LSELIIKKSKGFYVKKPIKLIKPLKEAEMDKNNTLYYTLIGIIIIITAFALIAIAQNDMIAGHASRASRRYQMMIDYERADEYMQLANYYGQQALAYARADQAMALRARSTRVFTQSDVDEAVIVKNSGYTATRIALGRSNAAIALISKYR